MISIKIIYKLLILLLLLLFFPTIVFSSESNKWNEVKPQDNEDIIIESEIRYNWYKEVKVKDAYKIYDSTKKDLIDTDDFIWSSTTESTTIPNKYFYREINTINVDFSFDTQTTSQILIDNFNYVTEIEISEIIVYDIKNFNYVSYRLNNSSVFNGEEFRINDYFMTKNCLTVDQNTRLLLELDREYNIKDLEIYIYISDNNKNTFDMAFVKEDKYKIQSKKLTIKSTGEPLECYGLHCKMIIAYDPLSWTTKSDFEETKYIYKDKLFMFYKIEKKYLNEYLLNKTGYKKDAQDFKIYYRYKLKNKLDKNSYSTEKSNIVVKAKEEKQTDTEEIFLLNVSKKITQNSTKYLKIGVIISLILISILIIGRNIHLKKKKSRTN